ncbi:ERF family protein [bacterium]|nr:ERF family protein [bacterium]
MNKSESIAELAKALNKFQAECSGAKKDADNPFFGSKYANLEAVINCAKSALDNNGLAVSQFPLMDQGYAGVETILMHSSGEWISNTLLLACKKQDPQAMGSAITYARRYAYQSVLGIPSEDDDGEKSMSRNQAPVKQQAPAPVQYQRISPAQATELMTIAQSKSKAGVDSVMKGAKISDIALKDYEPAKNALLGIQ